MIHGLSQRRTFVRGGKIRIGDRTTARNGRTIPRKLDHFRFVPQDPDLQPHWERLYGDKPTSLPIMLPSNERADIFPHEYRYWKGKNLFCRGDNREALRLGADGTRRPLPCTDQCPFRYDPESGQLLNGSLLDYCVPRADDLCDIDTNTDETTPCKINPLARNPFARR